MPRERSQTLRHEPLWERVDGNRIRMLGFVVAFVISASALIAASVTLAPMWLMSLVGLLQSRGAGDLEFVGLTFVAGAVGFAWLFPALLVLTAIYSATALGGARKHVAALVGAVPAPSGQDELRVSHQALSEIAIAAGLARPLELYVLTSHCDGALNACAFGTMNRAGIAVTPAFAEGVPLAEQRALFAGLISRIETGDVLRISAFLSILRPLVWIRDHENPFNNRATALLGIAWEALAYSAKLLSLLKNRGAWLLNEKADAEAMLRAKDPEAMLAAVDRLARVNTRVELDQIYGGLFLAPLNGTEYLTDAELKRLKRLREVLATEGGAYR